MDKYDYFYIDWIISSIYLELLNSPLSHTFLCLSLLKGCLPLRGEGSLWQATGSNRALVAKKFTYR